MHTALIKRNGFSTGWSVKGRKDESGICADFIFRDYRQLIDFVLH